MSENKNNNGWIKCSEGLPDNCDNILFVVDITGGSGIYENMICYGLYDDLHKCFISRDDEYYYLDRVTHWQHPPPPPETK